MIFNPLHNPNPGSRDESSDKSSGLFKLPPDERCRHPEHEFPKGYCIPHGHGYNHKCPGCGQVTKVVNDGPTF